MGPCFFSETRLYTAIYMRAMILLFMLNMYESKTKNGLVLIGSVAVFAISLFLVSSQTTVVETSWMKAMIPHHSIAILTISRANIEDMRVQTLANEIIKAQEREIKEMKWLLEDIGQNGLAISEQNATKRAVPDFSQQ
jgi:uncharacterized protein (DUF305 family)